MKQMEANITFTPILEQMAENCVLEWYPNHIVLCMETETLGNTSNSTRYEWIAVNADPLDTDVSNLTVASQMNRTSDKVYEDVSKSVRTGRLERELQMVQLSATRCSCVAILWVSLVSFAAIALYVASQRVIP
jgi:hypothetical protein